MPFLLMLFLTLACLPEIEDWPPPFAAIASPAWSSALTWLGVGLTTAWAYGLSRRLRRALAANPSRRDRAQYRYARRRFFHLFGLVGTYGLALYVLGWGWAVGQFWTWAGSGRLLPGAELVLLTPFLAGLLLSWTFFYDAERALHRASERAFEADPLARAFLEQEKADLTAKIGPVEDQGFWGRWSYVAFHARQNLTLVLVPVLLLVAEKELRRQFPEAAQEWQVGAGIAGLVVALSVFAGMPWIVRLMLGLRPMPAGPLRDRLLATAKRLNFRLSDLLVWNTRGAMATAMVVGVLPWPRYVLFTDRLLTDLSEDEIEAVFGHEAGHVKHHHMVYYLAFLLTSMAVLGILATVYLPELISLPSHRHLEALPFVGCLGAYVFVIFGFLSRRCERQADVFGCRAVSCQRLDCVGHGPGVALAPRGRGLCPVGIRTFIQALEKVAISNGISRDRPGFLQSWQHSTIARRVEFLQRVLTDPAAEPRFQRAVLVVKWVMFLSLAGVLALLIGVVGWNKVTM